MQDTYIWIDVSVSVNYDLWQLAMLHNRQNVFDPE